MLDKLPHTNASTSSHVDSFIKPTAIFRSFKLSTVNGIALFCFVLNDITIRDFDYVAVAAISDTIYSKC